MGIPSVCVDPCYFRTDDSGRLQLTEDPAAIATGQVAYDTGVLNGSGVVNPSYFGVVLHNPSTCRTMRVTAMAQIYAITQGDVGTITVLPQMSVSVDGAPLFGPVISQGIQHHSESLGGRVGFAVYPNERSMYSFVLPGEDAIYFFFPAILYLGAVNGRSSGVFAATLFGDML